MIRKYSLWVIDNVVPSMYHVGTDWISMPVSNGLFSEP